MAGGFWKGIINAKKSKKGQNLHQIVGNRENLAITERAKSKGRHWLGDRLRAVFTCPGGRWGSSQAPGPGPSPCCTPAPPPRPGQAPPPGCQPWSSGESLQLWGEVYEVKCPHCKNGQGSVSVAGFHQVTLTCALACYCSMIHSML